jgi:hypothetical protein
MLTPLSLRTHNSARREGGRKASCTLPFLLFLPCFPTYNLTDDAHGFVQGVSEVRAVHRNGLPVDLVGPPGEVPVAGRKGGREGERG